MHPILPLLVSAVIIAFIAGAISTSRPNRRPRRTLASYRYRRR